MGEFSDGFLTVIAATAMCTRRRETRPGTPRERRTLAEQKQTAGNLSQETVPGGAFLGVPGELLKRPIFCHFQDLIECQDA